MRPYPSRAMKRLRAAEKIIPNEIKEELKKYRKVFVQFPEGLKLKLWKIKEELEEIGLEVVFDSEPTYGFCDLKDEEALRLRCDVILHIGHNTFGFQSLLASSRLPVVIWEYRLQPNKQQIYNILEKYVDLLASVQPIGLVSSLQYLDFLKPIVKFLEEHNIKYILPDNPQILGCNVSNAKKIEKYVNSFLIPTAGTFYSLGLLLETEKKVLSLNLERNMIEDLEDLKVKYLKIIYWYLNKFESSKKVALLVSWKKGQQFYDIFKVKKFFERLNKEVIILSMDEIDQGKLLGIDCDMYINLACPRIFDGYNRFNKPILNFIHLLKYSRKLLEIWKNTMKNGN